MGLGSGLLAGDKIATTFNVMHWSTAISSLAEQSLLFHEQVTELEQTLLAACNTTPRDGPWARRRTNELVHGFRGILQQMNPKELPLFCAAGVGMEEVIAFQGFDVPPPSLFGILLEHSGEFRNFILFSSSDFDDEARCWAKQSDLKAVLSTPVMGSDGSESVEVLTRMYLKEAESIPKL